MLSKVLLTPVDDLVNIVKSNPNCSINFIQQKLKLPLEVIEKWIVILDEFSVLDVNYKGFEGYVSLSNLQVEKSSDKNLDPELIKDSFIDKAKAKGLNFDQINNLWSSFFIKHETDIKKLFEDKAKKAGYDKSKIGLAWQKYRSSFMRL